MGPVAPECCLSFFLPEGCGDCACADGMFYKVRRSRKNISHGSHVVSKTETMQTGGVPERRPFKGAQGPYNVQESPKLISKKRQRLIWV